MKAATLIFLASASAFGAKFSPPPESDIPDNAFGAEVRLGKAIFTDSQHYAKKYVGNGLNCVNCHLNAGRKADSAPLWGAYVRYPAFRKKTGQVDTFENRMQGCFKFSMNGTPPPAGSPELRALTVYAFWLAKGAPVGEKLAGAGYPELKPLKPDFSRGKEVYAANCAICHGENGEGTKNRDGYAFPPLWGAQSFNWGAGMHRIDTAAAFIKANMPLSRGGTLSDQDAWDVAYYVMSHDRPADPRAGSDIAQAKKAYHDENCRYGDTVKEEKE